MDCNEGVIIDDLLDSDDDNTNFWEDVGYSLNQHDIRDNKSTSSISLNSDNESTDFEIGQVVEVERRSWANMNKEGGAARITAVNAGKLH